MILLQALINWFPDKRGLASGLGNSIFHEVYTISWIERKGMTFDHHFGYSFPLLKKEGKRKGDCIAKIVIKSHAFLLDLVLGTHYLFFPILFLEHHLFDYKITFVNSQH